jgi:hypothetical protein
VLDPKRVVTLTTQNSPRLEIIIVLFIQGWVACGGVWFKYMLPW